MGIKNLKPEVIVALSRLFDEERDYVKRARREVAPGEHKVEGKLDLAGTLRVGEDSLVTPTYKLPLIKTLALMAQRMGATRDGTLRLIGDVAREALESGADLDGELTALIKDAEKEVARIRKEVVSKLTPVTRKGQARFDGLAQGQDKFARAAVS